MADLTADRAAAGFPVFQSHESGSLCVARGAIDLTTNPTAGDVLSMCKVPAGATVVDGFIRAVDLDTDATETIDLDAGWAANADEVADPDGFGNFGVQTGDAVAGYLPVAGIRLPFAGVLQSAGSKTFTAETTLTITAVAGAATGGTGYIEMVVYYHVT